MSKAPKETLAQQVPRVLKETLAHKEPKVIQVHRAQQVRVSKVRQWKAATLY